MKEQLHTYSIDDIEHKRIYGRTSKKDSLVLFWAASGLELKVKSKEVWALIESDYDLSESWITVKINGYRYSRQSLKKGNQWVCLMRNMDDEKENTILLQRDTQPMPGEDNNVVIIHKIAMPDKAAFCPVDNKTMHIEFIGDSITSGEGLYGNPSEMDFITRNFGGTKTYAVQAAEKLNASYDILSQCGWGVSFGWNGSTFMALPPHYNNVCSVMEGRRQQELGSMDTYDFNHKADAVVINLGTNDNSGYSQTSYTGDKDSKIIEDTYNFLKSIHNKNPDAKIIWAWGMINIDIAPELIKKGIEKFKADTNENSVFTLVFDPMEKLELTEEDKGSRNHPGPATHKAAAEKLAEFIKKITQ
ncbi:MAG: SGNH/GDSL hydrolase family protein [Treponema sp.]|nr:SGNH/GDSL hydrolase family protein [Treponema sp.]